MHPAAQLIDSAVGVWLGGDGDVQQEREVLFDQLADSGKPENIVEKIVAARLAKFAGEKSLAGQAHVVEGGKATVAAVVAKALPGFEVSGFALCTVGGDDAAE